MKVLSLFDGILERAGIRVERYVTHGIDKNAIEFSQKNYPLKGVVILIGGSPCHPFGITEDAQRDGEGAKQT